MEAAARAGQALRPGAGSSCSLGPSSPCLLREGSSPQLFPRGPPRGPPPPGTHLLHMLSPHISHHQPPGSYNLQKGKGALPIQPGLLDHLTRCTLSEEPAVSLSAPAGGAKKCF